MSRDGSRTLGAQIEDQLRRAIRDRRPATGCAALPSTRDLARQLAVSRRVVVDAYAQLAAEGYLSLRQGARPRVSAAAAAASGTRAAVATRPAPRARFDFRPSVPDVSTFPRAAWLRSLRDALATITDADLGYGDPRGVEVLRCALADYLGRVRGVVADPEHIVVTNGYTQGLGLVCHALAAAGAKRIALEDPSNPEDRPDRRTRRPGTGSDRGRRSRNSGRRSRARRRRRGRVDARPPAPHRRRAHRRAADGSAGLAARDATRSRSRTTTTPSTATTARPIGALQGLDPDRVIYAGSASKTLAPALRIGWLVVPPSLLRSRQPREAPRRPRYRPDRAARVRRLPDPRRARPPPTAHASPLPQPP